MELPEGLTEIGGLWFAGCVHLVSLSVSTTVQTIGQEAFYKCERLASVCFKPGSQLKTIESGAFCGTGVERMEFPQTLEKIGQGAFYACKSLAEVRFGGDSMLSEIGSAAFRGSGVREFCAPDKLQVIGSNAFEDCSQLRTVVLNWGLQSVGE